MKVINVCMVAMSIALAACSGGNRNQIGSGGNWSQIKNLPVVAHSIEVDGHEVGRAHV